MDLTRVRVEDNLRPEFKDAGMAIARYRDYEQGMLLAYYFQQVCDKIDELIEEVGGLTDVAETMADVIQNVDVKGLIDLNMPEAKALIKTIEKPETLDELKAIEEASTYHAGGRKGVLEAIEARRNEITEEEEEEVVADEESNDGE